MAKIKHGIIGTGGMARAHAAQFTQIRGVELFGCFDVAPGRAEAFAEKHVVKHALPSVDALLDACDSVSIVTPDAFHAELSLKTLKAGRHLLCEKPLTTNLADARKVARAAQAAAKEHGTIHMVNFSYRDSAAFQKAIQTVAAGRLGAIRHATGKYLQAWLASKVWGTPISEGWLWRQQIPPGGGKAAGGTLGDIGCHILDFTSAVAGDIKALRCTTRNFPKVDPDTGRSMTSYKGNKLDANDSVLIEFDLNNGGLGSIETTRWATGHPNQVALGVYGTEGALEIDLEQSYTTLRTCLGKARHKCEWKNIEVKPTPNNYQRFIRSIKTGHNDQADIVRGAQIQAYLDACERSAEDDGRRVSIRKWS
ncbi:MAG: Gfo/Idh/MocA family oxidoreductase [Planctomycetota bacterium]